MVGQLAKKIGRRKPKQEEYKGLGAVRPLLEALNEMPGIRAHQAWISDNRPYVEFSAETFTAVNNIALVALRWLSNFPTKWQVIVQGHGGAGSGMPSFILRGPDDWSECEVRKLAGVYRWLTSEISE